MIRFNFSGAASKVFILPHGKKVLKDGTAEDLLLFLIYSNNDEFINEYNKSIERVKGFDKEATKYRYEIMELEDNDFNLLIIDNISQFFGSFSYNDEISIIFKIEIDYFLWLILY